MDVQSKTVRVTGGSIEMLVAGKGPSLLLLHRDVGRPPWGVLQERLARSFTVIMPSLPGFERSERPDWLRNVPDMAAIVGDLIDRLDEGPANLVGLGFGGWVAAELLARDPSRVSGLFLHAPVGIKPTEGEIVDTVLWETMEYIKLGFASAEAFDAMVADAAPDQRDHWENNRDTVLRVAWKPYMYDPALPYLLAGTKAPTVASWSRNDRIVPRSAATAYAEAIPGARYLEFDHGGHHADIETPALLAEAIEHHFGLAVVE